MNPPQKQQSILHKVAERNEASGFLNKNFFTTGNNVFETNFNFNNNDNNKFYSKLR